MSFSCGTDGRLFHVNNERGISWAIRADGSHKMSIFDVVPSTCASEWHDILNRTRQHGSMTFESRLLARAAASSLSRSMPTISSFTVTAITRFPPGDLTGHLRQLVHKMLAKADDADKPVLEAQFARMYNLDDPISQSPGRDHQPAALPRRVQGRPGTLGEGRREGRRRQPGPGHRGPLVAGLQGSRRAGAGHVPPAVRGVGLQGGLPLRSGRPAQRVRRRGHAGAGARDPRREPQRHGQGAGHGPGL